MLFEILRNRELRVKRQLSFLTLKKPLVSISVNIPGSKKLSKDSIFIYKIMTSKLKKTLQKNYKNLHFQQKNTGIEGIINSSLQAKVLKQITCKLEEEEILGRFIDFDVINLDAQIISRKHLNLKERKCFLCENKAVICARSKAHDINELLNFISLQVKIYKKFQYLSTLATKAMLKEVHLTPKPGLVDKKDNGSHEDMDIKTFYKSIKAISLYFDKFIYIGFKENDIFLHLRKMGQECEEKMFQATNSINTHKGLIFSFAIILGACGFLIKQNQKINVVNLQKTIKFICQNLVQNDLSKNPKQSAGQRYYALSKNAGIRSEAQSGYESIFQKALPFYQEYKKIYPQNTALKYTLVFIMTFLEDTSIFNRGGLLAMNYTKNEAKNILNAKNLNQALNDLNQKFITKHISPGGSADILALTWFLDNILEL